MPVTSSTPLTDEHCACLDAVLTSEPAARDLIAKCKACGLDMEKAETELNYQVNLAKKLKSQFFPDRP